ncbi:MAG: hypothetical protein O3B72_02540, partial [Proteobacteria bacterium]|nr:hypothetical protein [Pseudomonadota bacterium]
KATPRDDDTFLNDEKGCLFLLTATRWFVQCFGTTFLTLTAVDGDWLGPSSGKSQVRSGIPVTCPSLKAKYC